MNTHARIFRFLNELSNSAGAPNKSVVTFPAKRQEGLIMLDAKLKNNILIGLACLIASFFIVLFPLGGLLDYLSRASNDFLNRTGLGFADGEADPSFLWVLGGMMVVVTVLLMIIIRKICNLKQG
ncbi:hypothetical protein [Enterobacter mori]|uniref:hypothetical protein n=2 Tax=Enterobacter mori TaxID=539813 RepID=UPI002E7A7FE8|nr:hypothetical protein [Enterobacter mori]